MSDSNHAYAELLQIMRKQGSKDNPTTIQLGVMQSPTSVKVGDLLLDADDLYMSYHLVAGYSRKLQTPYVSEGGSSKPSVVYMDGLKKGDLVAIQRLNDDKYIILDRVVSV